MSGKKPDKPRNFVAKHAAEFCKPKVFRDRKKLAKKDGNYQEHPRHKPYEKDRHNYLLDEIDDV